MMKYIKWAGIIISGLLIAAVVYVRLLPPNIAIVRVINSGSESIEQGEVNLCGEKANLSKIKPNEETKVGLKVNHDCHYEVVVKFTSGKQVSGAVGYVTHGLDFEDELIVHDDRVELGKSTAK